MLEEEVEELTLVGQKEMQVLVEQVGQVVMDVVVKHQELQIEVVEVVVVINLLEHLVQAVQV
tara:strand:+ start:629 stop:814 length:186 start_codon:yes stop_codon:yes gene_type:complete